MEKQIIDINADLGEGAPNDAAIMPLITSCNIACGGHAGSSESIAKTITLALENNVKIGAHPSYPDPKNFGRKSMEINDDDLYNSLVEQLERIKFIAEKLNAKIDHVKPHGALYNDCVKDKKLSKKVLNAVDKALGKVLLFVPPHSQLQKEAKNLGFSFYEEAFIDRRYNNDGSLVSRIEDGALITKAEEAWKQFELLTVHQQVETKQKEKIKLNAQTFCIHGDQENAVDILRCIHLNSKKINVV